MHHANLSAMALSRGVQVTTSYPSNIVSSCLSIIRLRVVSGSKGLPRYSCPERTDYMR